MQLSEALDLIIDEEERVEAEDRAATYLDFIDTLLSDLNLHTHSFDAYSVGLLPMALPHRKRENS